MFKSIYAEQLVSYYTLRQSTLSESACKHELCYLRRFDSYLVKNLDTYGHLSEYLMNDWVASLSGKSSSIENEVIVIRQFLKYLALSGEYVFLPAVPKIHDDYIHIYSVTMN